MRRRRILIPVLLVSCLGMSFVSSLTAQGLTTHPTYRAAYDRGYAEGHKEGTADKNGARPFEYANKRAFQRAAEGFEESRHDREIYRTAFRRGYEDGYEDGYELSDGIRSLPGGAEVRTVRDAASSNPPYAGSGGAVPRGTFIKIKLLDTLSTQRNERGDPVRAEVIEDVTVGGQIGIPKGSRMLGEITSLRRPGRIKGRAEMTLAFRELELASGGVTVPIEATVISIEPRSDSEVEEEGTIEGEGTKGEDAKRIGTAAGLGAVIGVLTGGKKGAQTGAAAGGITGLAGILLSRGRDLRLYSETELTVRLDQEVVIP